MQEIILKNLITIVFILFMIYSFVKGFKMGFVKKILSFGTIIITIIATKVFTPTIAGYVKDITNWESTLTTKIYDALMKSNVYDQLNVPILRDAIDTGNIQESIRDGLCTNIANAIINLICGIAVFIIVLILVKLALKVLDIIDYIPVVGQLNKILGGMFGIVEMIVITWILFTILRALENIPQVAVINNNIKESYIVSYLYNNNLIYNFLSNLFLSFNSGSQI